MVDLRQVVFSLYDAITVNAVLQHGTGNFQSGLEPLSERLISVCSGDLHMRKSFSPKEANHHGDYVQIPRALLLPIQH